MSSIDHNQCFSKAEGLTLLSWSQHSMNVEGSQSIESTNHSVHITRNLRHSFLEGERSHIEHKIKFGCGSDTMLG